MRAEYRGPVPLPAAPRESGPRGDLVGTFWAHVFVMSPRMTRALEELRLSGWRSYPVQVQSDHRTDDSLALLAVTGRAGPIYGVGGESRPGMNPIGQYLDPEECDGSDIFLPANRHSIHLAGPAADRIARLGLRNVDLEPAGLEPVRG